VLTPTRAFGQAPETDGVWYGVGAGYGLTMLNCAICSDVVRGGPTVQLRAGGKLSQTVLMGAEASGWMKRLDNVDQFVLSFHLTSYLYTTSTPGLFLKGGVGPTWFIANQRGDDGDLGSLGISIQFGVGYEARLGSNKWVTPYANVIGSGFGKLSLDDAVATDQFGVAQLQIGVSLTQY